MTMRRLFPLLTVAVAPMILAACGEGWEPQQVRNFVPYTEERTAGPGVEYVRARMLQEKGPVLEPAIIAPAPEPMPEPTPEEILIVPPEPSAPVKSSEDLFKEEMKK